MPPVIDREKCTDCGDCADECPLGVIEIIEEVITMADPDRCMECGQCVEACSEDAITME